MGVEQLILHTVGRRSGELRESPVAWFEDGTGGRVIIASGAFGFEQSRHPVWYLNLMAHPDEVSIELAGAEIVPVTARQLEGVERQRTWERIIAVRPLYAEFQGKTDREYPLITLAPR